MPIRITFHGAAGGVTGSAYEVETGRARLLVDFGVFQGGREKEALNRVPAGLAAGGLDAVVVTHGHLDHIGRLPLLVRQGFQGPIHCTPATIEIAELILRDSVKVQAQDLVRINRKRLRAGEEPLAPLYELPDVEAALRLFTPVPYDMPVEVAPGVRACFVEAGHMLGSASIQLMIDEDGGRLRRVVFSGDLGYPGMPILKDPESFCNADAVVLESTYGSRDHKPFDETLVEFEAIVNEVVAKKGKAILPTFAVGRAQLLLYLLAIMFRQKAVPKFPVYVDSPMAIEATRIYARHMELFDDDFQRLRKERPLARDLDTVRPTVSAEESRALNDIPGPCLILAGSGMCTGGRVLHHLKQNLWRPETSVIIVGFQAEGTLGRRLLEGEKRVSILGDTIAVKAKVHTLGGFSAHAGQTQLLEWLAPMAGSRPRVILTHGEDASRQALCALVKERYGLDCELPLLGESREV